MKLRILAIVAVMAMSVINPANAKYFSAKKLLSECGDNCLQQSIPLRVIMKKFIAILYNGAFPISWNVLVRRVR